MIQTFCTLVFQMRYGEMLKQARKAAGLTQPELAGLISSLGHSVSTSMVSMIETEYDKTQEGEPTRVNKDFVLFAAQVLKMDVNEALEAADYAPKYIYGPTFTMFDGTRVRIVGGGPYSEERISRLEVAFKIAYEQVIRIERASTLEPDADRHMAYVEHMEMTDETKQKPKKKKASKL